MAETTPNTAFRPSLGLLDGTMIVAGSMIGSGIFIVSANITQNVGGAGWLLFVWLITGFMTIVAAVSYGELSGMYPKAGGQYVYLKEAYNPLTGFLYGWSFFSVIQTGTIAAVAVAFCKFAGTFFPSLELNDSNILLQIGALKIHYAELVAIILILFLTYVNTRGIKTGKTIQTVFTVTKLVSMLGLVVFGLLLGARSEVWHQNWVGGWHIGRLLTADGGGGIIGSTPLVGLAVFGAIAASMTGSIFSSDAWNNAKRNIGLSLFLGTLIVTILYVCANVMYISVMSMHQIATAPQGRVATVAANLIFGHVGTYVIAVMIMISTFGCINGLVLAGARVSYTMAGDRLFFKEAGTLNRNAVPGWALWAQGVVACMLCLSGTYNDLLTMIAFVAVAFYALTVIGIFILRKKAPGLERPYKAFAYPVLPAVYIVLAIVFCVALIIQSPQYSTGGLMIVLLGIPLYYLAVSRRKKVVEAGAMVEEAR